MSAPTTRSTLRCRVVLGTLLLLSSPPGVCSVLAADTRIDRRAAEMPLPDPYLDPTWPEEQVGEGLGDRYEAGDTDNVEDLPLDDEGEMQAEQRALQALTGDAPPGPAAPAVPSGVAPPAAAVGPDGGAAPAAPVVDDDAEILPGDDNREPVEW